MDSLLLTRSTPTSFYGHSIDIYKFNRYCTYYNYIVLHTPSFCAIKIGINSVAIDCVISNSVDQLVSDASSDGDRKKQLRNIKIIFFTSLVV